MGSERALPDNMLMIHAKDWQRCLSENIRLEVALATAERDLADLTLAYTDALGLLDDHHANVYQNCAVCGAELDPHRPALAATPSNTKLAATHPKATDEGTNTHGPCSYPGCNGHGTHDEA
jgi:hypothetical protein